MIQEQFQEFRMLSYETISQFYSPLTHSSVDQSSSYSLFVYVCEKGNARTATETRQMFERCLKSWGVASQKENMLPITIKCQRIQRSTRAVWEKSTQMY